MSKRSGQRSADRGMRTLSPRGWGARPSARAGCSCEAPLLLEALGQEQKSHDEHEHAERNCGTQRPVESGTEEAHDDVGDHDAAGAAEEKRRQEITQAEYERKRRARYDTRNRQRKNHTPEGLGWRCAEVV